MENINIAILQNAAIAMFIYRCNIYVPINAFLLLFFFQVKREKIWFKTCLLSVWVCKMFLRICLQNISFIFWGVCEKNIFWGVCENIIFWGVCENIIFWGVCARWGAVSLSQPLSFTSCQWLLPLYPLVDLNQLLWDDNASTNTNTNTNTSVNTIHASYDLCPLPLYLHAKTKRHNI